MIKKKKLVGKTHFTIFSCTFETVPNFSSSGSCLLSSHAGFNIRPQDFFTEF